MRVLNLYAGLGGNRKLWQDVQVTAVEHSEEIAATYHKLHPHDEVVVGDAHRYLLEHYAEFDFIWSSPPCQSHSKMIRSGRNRKPRYPDMKLYEEILFLQHNFAGQWIVENVVPYYKPLIPAQQIGRHLFWSNFAISMCDVPKFENFINRQNIADGEALKAWLGLNYDGNIYYDGNHCPTQVLRNCVHPDVGNHIMNCATGVAKTKQAELAL